jgi:hypothetical protein
MLNFILILAPLLTKIDVIIDVVGRLLLYYCNVFTGYKIYNISTCETIKIIQNKLVNSDSYDELNKVNGLCFNIPIINNFTYSWFYEYINEYSNQYFNFYIPINKNNIENVLQNDLLNDFFILKMYDIKQRDFTKKNLSIFCNKKTFEKLTLTEKKQKDKISYYYTLYNPSTESWWSDKRFVKKTMDATNFVATHEQNIISNIIIDNLDINKCFSALILGPPGSGKSSIINVLACKFIQKNIIPIFIKPEFTNPCVNLDSIINHINMTEENQRLIIILDEIDILFRSLSDDKEIKPHEHFPIFVKNKRELNNLFDLISDNERCSLIGFTNLTYYSLEAIEPSFIRKGRFDFKFNLHYEICEEIDILNIKMNKKPENRTIDYVGIHEKYIECSNF